ncbi:hypothetical protein A2110_02180 [Candidatus Jorgensenbacteria bacterium GWA1_54_12]|uniref:PDZ domain-containing protein n=1 Tax=Candidatus Jorgensenbacteria bacterium GWA1_54_12 TaxID=1798468 RepID=A0A1F6BLX5_9BACT|nr:MAG: hypothetical protein A2110_02180 [Candidatus Jorgensenbacteria bacterium GWA1_54_12]
MIERRQQYALAVFGALLIAALGFYGGMRFTAPAGSQTPDIPALEGETDLSLLEKTLALIKGKYFKPEDINDKNLLYGAVSGAVDALGDPYSQFFAPEDAQKFEEDITGNFGGIGAEIGIREDELIVVAPLKGNPAEKAGLLSGDHIMRIDETATNGMAVEEAVKLIRGERGTAVSLLIDREEWNEPREIKVVRGDIIVPTVDWEMKDGDITYLHLYNFNANAPSAFYRASFEALLQGTRGLILDLRGNTGGFLEVATDIAGWFLDRGDVIVEERFRDGDVRDFRANGGGVWGDKPLVVLVDGGSASAAEILAGAIRDRVGAPLVGEQTFGKGTVQELEEFADGSKVKLSVAEWVTPEGHRINGEGLAPDVVVPYTLEDREAGRDPQLEKALEIIRKAAEGVEAIPTYLL